MGSRPLEIADLEREILEIVKRDISKLSMSQRAISAKTSIDQRRLRGLFASTRDVSVADLERLCDLIGRKVSSVVAEAEEALLAEKTAEESTSP